MTPQTFIQRWRGADGSERSPAQNHASSMKHCSGLFSQKPY
ncbi:MAG: hypothetical protein PHV02_19360 [Rhodocyclaceae bacterium]|nr:hypothetical protein [Rhodocyclaceae bacterium]